MGTNHNFLEEHFQNYSKVLLSEFRLRNSIIELESIQDSLNQINIQIQELENKFDGIGNDWKNLRGLNIFFESDSAEIEKDKKRLIQLILERKEFIESSKALELEIQILKSKTQKKESLKNKLDQIILNHEKLLENEFDLLKEYRDNLIELNKLYSLEVETEEALLASVELGKLTRELIKTLRSARDFRVTGSNFLEVQNEKSRLTFINNEIQSILIQIKNILIRLKNELQDIIVIESGISGLLKELLGDFNLKYYKSIIDNWIIGNNIEHTFTLSHNSNTLALKLNRKLEQLFKTISNRKDELVQKNEKILKIITT